jgi:hypothetical protein
MRLSGKSLFPNPCYDLHAENSSRGITRDPNVYPDPESFRPERWLLPSYPTYREPLSQYPTLKGYSQFGFGRRTCQGVDIVEQELFLVMGGLAWAFDISKKKNSWGREIDVPTQKYTSLLIAKPEKFLFDAKPVSEERLMAVKKGWEEINDGSTGGKTGQDILNEKDLVIEKSEVPVTEKPVLIDL